MFLILCKKCNKKLPVRPRGYCQFCELEIYEDEIPDYADVMTIQEFNGAVEDGFIINGDGIGYYVKNNKMNRKLEVFYTVEEPKDATHVAWFNK